MCSNTLKKSLSPREAVQQVAEKLIMLGVQKEHSEEDRERIVRAYRKFVGEAVLLQSLCGKSFQVIADTNGHYCCTICGTYWKNIKGDAFYVNETLVCAACTLQIVNAFTAKFNKAQKEKERRAITDLWWDY